VDERQKIVLAGIDDSYLNCSLPGSAILIG
jgi:hypothetical protein